MKQALCILSATFILACSAACGGTGGAPRSRPGEPSRTSDGR